MSVPVTTSAPARSWSAMRSLPIMQETASSSTANVPPKPQHSSGRASVDELDARELGEEQLRPC